MTDSVKKPLSERWIGYVLAIAAGTLGGPIGWLSSPLVLLGLTKVMKEKDGKHPNRFLAWAAIGIVGVPLSVAPLLSVADKETAQQAPTAAPETGSAPKPAVTQPAPIPATQPVAAQQASAAEKVSAAQKTSAMAAVQCQNTVLQTLAGPSEARFPNLTKPPFRDVQPDGSVRILGVVDAQNRFGAMRRLGYKCHLIYDKGDPAAASSWQIYSAKVDPIE